jgi:hypothetical protein
MDFDQNGIIEKTRRALTPFSFLKTIAMIVIYVGVVILFFIVLKIDSILMSSARSSSSFPSIFCQRICCYRVITGK